MYHAGICGSLLVALLVLVLLDSAAARCAFNWAGVINLVAAFLGLATVAVVVTVDVD